MDAQANADLTDQLLLHYRVKEQLGAGGMGVVYRALDLKLGRTVALKFLLDSNSVSDEAKQRFMREAMASSALEHTNIGTLHSIEESSDGRLFMVMACYEGPTLAHRIVPGPMPLPQAVSIMLQLLHGLAEAHKHGIVHRDIKPGNLIFNSQGVLKILDFGLAKLHGSPDLTLPGSTLGTVAYMAPEQVTGEALDHRSDLWSAGVVFYELLAGRQPFRGPDIRSILTAVIAKEPEPLPSLTPAIEKVLWKALAKSPENRYQSAKEMIADLEAAQGMVQQESFQEVTLGSLATVSMPSLLPRVEEVREERPGSRKRWLAGLFLAAFLVAAGLAAWRVAVRGRGEFSGVRIAVLPLTATGESPGETASAQALSDGLRLEVIRSLSDLEPANPNLLVVPSSQLATQHVNDPASARSSLGLGTVLTGSFVKSGSQVHVVMSSVDTADSKVLRIEQIDGTTNDVSKLGREMTLRAVKLLGLKSTPEVLMGAQASNLSADQNVTYLASLGYLERWDKPGDLEAAIQGFTSVTAKAPEFAPAYSGLANCYLRRYQATKDGHALELAELNAAHGAQLNGGLSDTALALGQVRILQGRFPEAIEQFQRVLAADARSNGAYSGLAKAYAAMGLSDKAEQAWHKAIDLRPNSVDAYNQLAIFEMGRGDYAGAAANFRKASRLAPDNAPILGNLGAALAYSGAADESRSVLQRSIQLAPAAPAWNNLGDLDLKQGHFADAANDYEKALEFNKADYRVWSNMAAAYARTPGQKDKSKDAFLHAAQMTRESLKTNPNDPRNTIGPCHVRRFGGR